MLKRLYITNFALINQMDVTFPGKLTVITGETGAGKSIFLEALGLVLGKRAELSTLKSKEKKCIIEAEFETKNLDLKTFFEEHDLDFESTLVLRREINSDGKSRSFLNDSVVSLSVLKLLSERLIDIHSQHQTLLLNQSNFQLELVDAFAGTLSLFKEFKVDFNNLSKLKKSLLNLQDMESQAKKDLDYYQFLFDELEDANIKEGSLKQLEEESESLENAENIKNSLSLVANSINGGDTNILSQVNQLKSTLQSISKYGKNYSQFFERLNSVYIELKELVKDIEDAESNVNVDSKMLIDLNMRLDKINRLLKKHQVKTDAELLILKKDFETKLSQFGSLEKEIAETQKQIKSLSINCEKKANELSKSRNKITQQIENEVKKLLQSLLMENAQFKIELIKVEELSSNGIDELKFLFSANKGVVLNELHKVASGGELSRLMLSLKSLLATKKQLPTIIFDEIDTGVSGDVADKIGTILLNMGNGMQVIAITHLPQMASKGQHHLFVYKKDEEDKTVSYIKELNKEERVSEIAKMLSTSKPTASALKNAKELLSTN